MAFANVCNDMIQLYDIDGIDIDWEFPGYNWEGISACKNCVKDYTKLLQSVRGEIGNDKLLTIAGTANLLMIGEYENRKIADIIDFVNVMNYDYNNTNHADFELTKNCLFTWHLAGYPKTMLNLGVPFYGRSKDKTYQYNGYNKIKQLIDDKTAVLYEKSSQSYAKIGKSKISFDTPNMIRKKAKFTIDCGYGGIFCWQLATDYDNELLTAMWSEYQDI